MDTRMGTTKDRILLEALRLFSRNGYEAVSVEQIANAVGIKAPSLYKHYRGKRDIFDSITARMSELDAQQAREYDMPEEAPDEAAAAYKTVSIDKIKTYTKAQFAHWTEESVPSDFRRLLTLEQYRDPEMAALYQQYLAGGPLAYMKDIFASITGRPGQAEQLALAFYAPMFMLYSLYDGTKDKKSIWEMLDQHIDDFFSRLSTEKEGEKDAVS